jgi:16S rRNA processing protein RimM
VLRAWLKAPQQLNEGFRPVAEYSADLLVIGKITGIFGVKGWVKVHSYTDPLENFLNYKDWLVDAREGWKRIEFDRGRRHGKGLVAHIKDVDDRSIAEAYLKSEVAIHPEQLKSLPEGEYYWNQLQGLDVWALSGEGRELLGSVAYLLETGANDVLVVKSSETSLDDRERLIPYLQGEVVQLIDLDAGYMDVIWDKEF